MAIGDQAGLQAVKELNEKTIPALTKAVESLVESADRHIDEDLVQIFKNLDQTLGTLMTDIFQAKKELVDDLHCVLDRVNGITVTSTIQVPPREIKQ